jgi:hypothetical protein
VVKSCCGHSLCTFSPLIVLSKLTLLSLFIPIDIPIANSAVMSNFVLYEERAQPVMLIQANVSSAKRCLNCPSLVA